jgi:hypothetical protein
MRQQFHANSRKDLIVYSDSSTASKVQSQLKIAFAVRDVGEKTGRRIVSNLQTIQKMMRDTLTVRNSIRNVTFEHLNVSSTVQYMADTHIFISVHGAAMANMFFMNPGSAVIEIIPYPLCSCKSPDYFYGAGGFYHGSSIAQGIRHYHYCVQSDAVVWHKKPHDLKDGIKCSWKHLHAVDSVHVNAFEFISLVRKVVRDLVDEGTIVLEQPIINVGPHVNG